MTAMEKSALKHVAEYERYSRSAQSAIDNRESQMQRAVADRKAGHIPECSLTRCANGCKAA